MGLLDDFSEFIKTPGGQGLLSAAFGGLAGAQKGAPLNSLGRAGLAGLSGYGGAIDRQTQQAQEAQMQKYRQAQIDNYGSEVEARKATAAMQAKKDAAMANAWLTPVSSGSINVPEMGGVDMFSQGVKVGAPSVQGKPVLNVPALLAAHVSPAEIQSLANLDNLGKQEVARTIKGIGPDGKEYEYQIDKFGAKIGDGYGQWKAPLLNDGGGQTNVLDPYNPAKVMGSIPKTMTFADKNSAATLGLSREKFNYEKANDNKPQLVDGQWIYKPDARNPQGVTVPVAGFQGKPQEAFMKASKQLNDLDGALVDYKKTLGEEGGVWGTGAMPRGIPIPWTGMNIPLPQGETSTKISSRYTSLMMGLKNLYELGALAGPDMKILEGNLTDPSTFAGFLSSKGSYDEQIKTIEGMMKRAKMNLGTSYGHKVPEAASDSPRAGGASGDFSGSDPLGLFRK